MVIGSKVYALRQTHVVPHPHLRALIELLPTLLAMLVAAGVFFVGLVQIFLYIFEYRYLCGKHLHCTVCVCVSYRSSSVCAPVPVSVFVSALSTGYEVGIREYPKATPRNT